MNITINGKFFAQAFSITKDAVIETAKTVTPVVKESVAVGTLYSAEKVVDGSIYATAKMNEASNKLQAVLVKKMTAMQSKYSK